jgi:integrase
MDKVIEKKLKSTKNVADRNGKLRIQFKLPDRTNYIWRSTGLDTTKHNIDLAVTKLSAVKTDIVMGIYKKDQKAFWSTRFPLSKEAQVKDETILLSDMFTLFKEERDHEIGYSMMNKLKTCENWVKSFKLLNRRIIDITTEELTQIRKHSLKTRKAVTVREYSQMLKQVFDLAISYDIIEKDPFIGLRKLPKDDLDVDGDFIFPFSQKELNALIEVVHIPQTKKMIEMLAWTGLRHGELKALAWEDVDFNNNCLRVRYNIDRLGNLKPPKTQAGVRKVELLPTVVKLLKEQKEHSFNNEAILETIYYKNYRTKQIVRRRVFLSRDNQPFKRPELTTNKEHWRNWLKQAEIPYKSPYQLRHTYASQMLKVKADLTWLALQMGHKNWGNIQTVYGKWIENESPDYIKELAEQLGQKYS